MFGEKRPNLVILDEIDGADAKGAIAAVVDIISAPLASSSNTGRKGSSVQALTRPLICICNDAYSPHLRPLRDIALVFKFDGTNEARLMSRLKVICRAEHMGDVSTASLAALCHATGNDMRSCINTLQFVATRQRQQRQVSSTSARISASASTALLQAIESGIKDERKDIFEVFSAVFWRKLSRNAHLAKVRRSQAIQQSSGEAVAAMAWDGHGKESSGESEALILAQGNQGGAMFAMKCADSHGDYERIYMGVHENFLNVPYNDPRCIKTCGVLDWLGFHDKLQRRIDESQHWSFLRYMPAAAAAVHILCSVDTRHRMELPREVTREYFVYIPKIYCFLFSLCLYYLFQMLKQNSLHKQRSGILQSFVDLQSSSSSRSKCVERSSKTAAMDLIPQLLTILSPNIRSVRNLPS